MVSHISPVSLFDVGLDSYLRFWDTNSRQLLSAVCSMFRIILQLRELVVQRSDIYCVERVRDNKRGMNCCPVFVLFLQNQKLKLNAQTQKETTQFLHGNLLGLNRRKNHDLPEFQFSTMFQVIRYNYIKQTNKTMPTSLSLSLVSHEAIFSPRLP